MPKNQDRNLQSQVLPLKKVNNTDLDKTPRYLSNLSLTKEILIALI